MELNCKVQNYEWGKKGSESVVAQLKKSSNTSFTVDKDLPYAELWMGTHSNAPSVMKDTNENLSEIILQHPEYLGEGVLKVFQELPFLLKVLSVNKALSIQAHPSKVHPYTFSVAEISCCYVVVWVLMGNAGDDDGFQALFLSEHAHVTREYVEVRKGMGVNDAGEGGNNNTWSPSHSIIENMILTSEHPRAKHAEELHLLFPDIYKDANHKPEMAIALTPFEALCGFKPLAEIKMLLNNIPELQSIVGTEVFMDDSQLIQKAFKAVLTSDKENIKNSIDGILRRYKESEKSECGCLYGDLVERLHSQFPYDNGVLMVYFLNYLKLKPSQAIFLGANEPHAYLFGVDAQFFQSTPQRFCEDCKEIVSVKNWTSQLRTNSHKQNSCIFYGDGIQELRSAFKCRIVSYKLHSSRNHVDIKEFKKETNSNALLLIRNQQKKHTNVKVNAELFGIYYSDTLKKTEVKSFYTPFFVVSQTTDLSQLYEDLFNILESKADEFPEKDSDCIECMACSDNVVRAGLTPKFVDVDTLCSMLIYEGAGPEEKLFMPVQDDDFSVIFRPPVPDFAVAQIQVPESTIRYTTKSRSSASILLIISGQAQYKAGIVLPGTVLFIPANEVVTFTNLKGELLMYQAMANV